MKYILVAVFSTFLSQSASPADLTGRWVAETQSPNGEKRQTIFAFKSEGDKLTGYLVSAQGDDLIADGLVISTPGRPRRTRGPSGTACQASLDRCSHAVTPGEIGNGGMSLDEYRVHMSLWSILAAPLIAGNDLRDMPADISASLTDKEVIAVDQDALGRQGVRVSRNGDLEVWSRRLAGGAIAVGLFNRGADHSKVTARWSDLGIKGSKNVRDLWAHSDRDEASGVYSADVASHGVVMLKLW
jgi:hypothetical protein